MLSPQKVVSKSMVVYGKVVKVPFVFGVGPRCMYLELTQVCIAQGKPIKPTHK